MARNVVPENHRLGDRSHEAIPFIVQHHSAIPPNRRHDFLYCSRGVGAFVRAIPCRVQSAPTLHVQRVLVSDFDECRKIFRRVPLRRTPLQIVLAYATSCPPVCSSSEIFRFSKRFLQRGGSIGCWASWEQEQSERALPFATFFLKIRLDGARRSSSWHQAVLRLRWPRLRPARSQPSFTVQTSTFPQRRMLT